MALADSNELQNKILGLKRTPCPRVPSGKQNPFEGIKLRPTGTKIDSEAVQPCVENGDDIEEKSVKPLKKERSLSVKERLKALEGDAPLPCKPKPAISTKPKPIIQAKPSPGKNGETRLRPPSVIEKPRPDIPVEFKDTRIPDENPFPPIHTLGNPPIKPPKLWHLKTSLKKYIDTTYPPRPTPPEAPPITKENETTPSTPLSYDAPEIPARPPKETAIPTNDVDDLDENADDSDGGIYDDTFDGQSNADVEAFGDDIYEPITGEQDVLPTEKGSAPPVLPPHTEKKAKEEKKKKEKEEKEKRKKEREEKEREEKEKKKREKEKEKRISEMKKKFSIRGNGAAIGTCCAAVDVAGNKYDIQASIGETFDIIRKDKPNPSHKWLVRNQVGEYGFIDIDNVESEEGQGEELYEDVNAVKQSISNSDDNFPSAPTKSPPPPPGRNPSTATEGDQEIYDDIQTDENGEELYEMLDN